MNKALKCWLAKLSINADFEDLLSKGAEKLSFTVTLRRIKVAGDGGVLAASWELESTGESWKAK